MGVAQGGLTLPRLAIFLSPPSLTTLNCLFSDRDSEAERKTERNHNFLQCSGLLGTGASRASAVSTLHVRGGTGLRTGRGQGQLVVALLLQGLRPKVTGDIGGRQEARHHQWSQPAWPTSLNCLATGSVPSTGLCQSWQTCLSGGPSLCQAGLRDPWTFGTSASTPIHHCSVGFCGSSFWSCGDRGVGAPSC